MNKIGLVIEREYLSRVKKKSFLLMTILVPLLIVAFYAIIVAVAVNNSDESQKIAVIDEAGIISNQQLSQKKNLGLEKKDVSLLGNYEKHYKDSGYTALLHIPKIDIENPKGVNIYSKGNMSLQVMSNIEDIVNKGIEIKRMNLRGINYLAYDSIKSNISVSNKVDSREGQKESVAGVSYIISLACGLLIYMMMLIYGSQVMRGVSEEKVNRVSEVIASSAKPFDLMMGKVIGIGLVGLTQFMIWAILGSVFSLVIPMMFPQLGEIGNTATSSEGQEMISQVSTGLSSLPFFKILVFFLIYFIFGYLMYAALFAAVGSLVSDDQNEAQQLVFPIMMPIILGFVIMIQAINNPNSSMAVFGSLFPLTSPVVMMGRITYEIPVWQLALSVVLLIGSFLFFTWLAAKIYRIGILMYGKKPSWKQIIKMASQK